MIHPIAVDLRAWCLSARSKPHPIADVIPLLQRAADELDRLNKTIADLNIEEAKHDKDN